MWCGRKKTWNFPWQWFLIQFHLLLKVPIITSAPAVSWTSSSCIFMSFPWKTISFFFRIFPFLPQCQVQRQQPNCSSCGGAGRERIRGQDSRWWLLDYYYPQLVNVWGPLLPHLFQIKKKRKSSSSFRFYSRTYSAGSLTCCSQWYATHTRSLYKYSSTHTHTHGARLSFPTFFFLFSPVVVVAVLSFHLIPLPPFSLSLLASLLFISIWSARFVPGRRSFIFFLQSDTASKFRLELFGRWRFYIDCNRRNNRSI